MHGPEYEIPATISGLQFYHSVQPFPLEQGGELSELTIAYHTYGEINSKRDNVIWVCHALTANSNVADWWGNLFGEGKILDPSRYFIVCANVVGSCYGTTGPRSKNTKTNQPYGMEWPLVTIRDWVKAHDLLRTHLGVEEINLCLGGSCGGHQVLEFALLIPERIKHLGLLVTSARETSWAIAGHEAQRLAMEADASLIENTDIAGEAGMKAARGMALLGYRTFESYVQSQTDNADVLMDLKASTYIRHQGDKLVKRFYAHCYYHLTRSLDSHHLGRSRGSLEEVLGTLTMKSTIVGIDSDRLIPLSEQAFLNKYISNSSFHIIPSLYGHDGFLIEGEEINAIFSGGDFDNTDFP
ncbi:MAG: homoserine O-acetyltransferase [Bacteroidota bacterium]|nr:homoserine O-acetyltransferase [Bacteroidota bacterium]